MPNIIIQLVTLYMKTNQYEENLECMGHSEDVSDALNLLPGFETKNTPTTAENQSAASSRGHSFIFREKN